MQKNDPRSSKTRALNYSEIRNSKKEKIIKTACSSHCGGRCLLKVHVENDIITRIETDDGEEPQLRACLRCRAYRQRVYDPLRVKFPMKRIGARGEGKFERISWKEALETIVNELNRARNVYGPSSVLFLGGGGDSMRLHHSSIILQLLQMSGGCTRTWGMHSYEGGLFAALATYGTIADVSDFDDLLNSRLIIMWGLDPAATIHETNTTLYLKQARESGVRIISVDPRYTDSTAILAQDWIPIIPNTDTAMLMAMAYVMIKKKLFDENFLDTYTVGFNQFKDYVLGLEDGIAKTPAWAADITGVSENVIEKLAKDYATIKPAALIAGIAPGRTAYGEQFHRAAHTLQAMTGNIGIHGGWSGRSSAQLEIFGGFNFKMGTLPQSGGNPVEFGVPQRKFSLRPDSEAQIHYSEVADTILEGRRGHYPADIKMVFVLHTNPVNQFPNTNKMVRALKEPDFIAVAEQVMTATAKFADVLLPVSTFLERNDITTGGATPFYGYINKAIDPLYESKSPLEICKALATKLGISVYNEKSEDEWLRHLIKGSYVPDYDAFKKKAIYRVPLQESRIVFKEQIEDPAHNPFPTPSGKIEIYCQRLADMNNPLIPPIPKFIEPWESRNDPIADEYPLQLITSHCKIRTHTQFHSLPWLRELMPQALSINPIDAEKRAINTGDIVRVFNNRGEVVIPAKVTERILPGVVDLPQGSWYSPDENGIDKGGCSNVLSKDVHSPGGATCYNTGLVQVEKV